MNLLLAFRLGADLPSPGFAALGAVTGFFGIGVSLVLFMLGLRHLGTARTGAYFSLAPFIGAVFAIVFLSEPATLQLLGTGALMGVGLWFHLTEKHDHEHTHKAVLHGHVHDLHHTHGHDGPVSEPNSRLHRHELLRHKRPQYPDPHHRHDHH